MRHGVRETGDDPGGLIATRERFFRERGMKPGPVDRRLLAMLRAGQVGNSSPWGGREGGGQTLFRITWEIDALVVGKQMEQTADIIHAVNKEVAESRVVLQQLKNDVGALVDVIHPQLMEHARELRAARMSVVTELQTTMNAMRDVRKFFLESDYETEMARLERFIGLCREFQRLKADGVLDVMADVALRLAVGGAP